MRRVVTHQPSTTGTELTAWLQSAGPGVADVVRALADTCARLATMIATAAPDVTSDAFDCFAHDLFIEALRSVPVNSVCSEQAEDVIVLDATAGLDVAIDPLDGASNLSTNAPVGTIFSILAAPSDIDVELDVELDDEPDHEPAEARFLRPGNAQLAAGFVMYGAAVVMALTIGTGTTIFVLDRTTEQWFASVADAAMPAGTREYAINASNYRHWDPRLRVYVDDLIAGSTGPRGEDFNMRWTAALVADAYRILVRGGIFLYPADDRPGYGEGRLRLVYEANPVAFLVEQAGGSATDGRSAADGGRILDKRPTTPHERTPLVFGSADKVERLARYHDGEFTGERSPLFAKRGLFR